MIAMGSNVRRAAFWAAAGAACLVAAGPVAGEGRTALEFRSVVGRVEVVSADGGTARAQVGAAVGEGDRVRTGDGGRAVLRVDGGGIVVVGPRTDIGFERLQPSATLLDLPSGSVWARANPGRGGSYEVRTPIATAGVRGTKFAVMQSEDRALVCNCTGRVEVGSPEGSTTIRTGEFAEVRPGGPAPRPASERRVLRRPPRDGSMDFCFTCHIPGGGGTLRRGDYFSF